MIDTTPKKLEGIIIDVLEKNDAYCMDVPDERDQLTHELMKAIVMPQVPEEKWLIWSNEHNGWWRPDSSGYTNHRELAGRYSFEAARDICRGANRHVPWDHMPDEKMPVPKEAMIPEDKP